jgi:hypothetical protein
MPDSDVHLPPRNIHGRRPEIAAIILPLWVAPSSTTDVSRHRVTVHRGTRNVPLLGYLSCWCPRRDSKSHASLHRLLRSLCSSSPTPLEAAGEGESCPNCNLKPLKPGQFGPKAPASVE